MSTPANPNREPWISAMQIDAEIATADPCPECGSPMEYRSEFSHSPDDNRASYRAFAVCTNPECDTVIEF